MSTVPRTLSTRAGAQPGSTAPLISNARLGIILLIAGESMLFGGLIGAFLVFRFGARVWPPPGMPYLPVAVTSVNTLVLFSSCYPMTRALRAVRRGDLLGLRYGIALTTVCGLIFLSVQGWEWLRLLRHGLAPSSGPYGSTFYTLIGFHGFHVVAAVLWLAVVFLGSQRGRFSAARHTAVELAAVYWYFVCAVWAVLFPLVYLGLGD
jgi:cytochrome c oxidase subunit 3